MKLEEYEEICPECEGEGSYVTASVLFTDQSGKPLKFKCNKCGGTGKTNWLDKIYNRNERCYPPKGSGRIGGKV
jgi:DnaJ-class molecular chaperone